MRLKRLSQLTALLATTVALAAACGKREASAPAPTEGAPSAAAASLTAGPAAAKQPMGDDGTLHVHAEDRCPVCAMVPQQTPKFASGLELDDGRTFYTCGTGCLIRSYLHPEVYLGAGAAGIKRAYVPDYFTGKPIAALDAHWVAGSDVVGPMGPALVPLAAKADADTFVARHGGEHRFRLGELDDDRWQQITGKAAVKPKDTGPLKQTKP